MALVTAGLVRARGARVGRALGTFGVHLGRWAVCYACRYTLVHIVYVTSQAVCRATVREGARRPQLKPADAALADVRETKGQSKPERRRTTDDGPQPSWLL